MIFRKIQILKYFYYIGNPFNLKIIFLNVILLIINNYYY